MASFGFSQEKRSPKVTVFNGTVFYNVYKNADFLRVNANVENLLSRGYEVRQKLRTVPLGDSLVIQEMNLGSDSPLIVKRAGKGVTVEEFEFTYNRLQGLVAAYAYENRLRFPVIEATEAKALELVWEMNKDEQCKLYLSAVSGTDNMVDQFTFYPFLCGLRKFHLKKIPIELVVGMGYVKNNDGLTMAKLFNQNIVTAKRLWLKFPGSSLRDLDILIRETPQLKKLFER